VLAEYGVYAGDERALKCAEKALKNLHERMLEGSTKLRQWGRFRWFEALIPLGIIKDRFGGEWTRELAALLKEQGADYAGYTEEWKTPLFHWRIFTHIVNLWVREKRISSTHCRRPLWTVLHEAGIYKPTESNWNTQIIVRRNCG
jgi:hypothetical protein